MLPHSIRGAQLASTVSSLLMGVDISTELSWNLEVWAVSGSLANKLTWCELPHCCCVSLYDSVICV